MSQRRRAQIGLVSAASILLLTIGVLFIGAKASLDRQPRAGEVADHNRVTDVSIASVHQK